MPISWNEIRDRAHGFSREWENERSEDAEAKSFWDAFFHVFGVPRRRVASFEKRVKKLDGADGFIDLLWKGVLLVEHKSRGRDLGAAHEQAFSYFTGLKDEDLPQYVLTCDFNRFRLHDLESGEHHEFTLSELHKNIHLFGFLAGYQKRQYKAEDPVNVKAAELMAGLHDRLREAGYEGHHLRVFLVRMLFCLFADDTGIFERDSFRDFIELSTKEDGTDVGSQLTRLYQALNTPLEKRMKTTDEILVSFPYVNGRLFEESLPLPEFNSSMRTQLIKATALDWGAISPAIFGSLFQAVMNQEERRKLGAHYTSEKNILKVINPLFMDDLREEFESIKINKSKLQAFHSKIASLQFLDPACGCGNFLIVAYRELRLLEIEVLKLLIDRDQQVSVDLSVLVNVHQFCGIEIEEFPSQISQVGMWLIDHLMNLEVSATFGTYYVRLPLTKSANIVNANALRLNWADIGIFDFIFGNPPFIGAKWLSDNQRADMASVFAGNTSYGVLDFVSAWYVKAMTYLASHVATRCAYVSTNSITQGEQVNVLWEMLITKMKLCIHFAHRTFRWMSEARGAAAVHVVIIGFGHELCKYDRKKLYTYESISGEPHETHVKRINPYLVDAENAFLESRSRPIASVPIMVSGNKPIDDGNYLFSKMEKEEFLLKEPQAEKYFLRWLGAEEFLSNTERWCLWLGDCSPTELRNLPHCLSIVEEVKLYRLNSNSMPTNKLATTPTRFHTEYIPDSKYLALPEVSSERREYIPVAFLDETVLCSNKLRLISNADLYLFGVLMSKMHMSWVRSVSGRLKSDFQYSIRIVYNNFPFPAVSDSAQKMPVERAAQTVLDVRAGYPHSSLADLYDPLTMPPDLVKAHTSLDKTVDKCYRSQPFESESKRIEFLFALYEEYTAPLIAMSAPRKRTSKKG